MPGVRGRPTHPPYLAYPTSEREAGAEAVDAARDDVRHLAKLRTGLVVRRRHCARVEEVEHLEVERDSLRAGDSERLVQPQVHELHGVRPELAVRAHPQG